jgi:hypothetical protein
MTEPSDERTAQMAVTEGADSAAFTITLSDIVRAVKYDWRWLSVYVIATLSGLAGSYYFSGLLSVGIAVVVDAITFYAGFRMREVIITVRRY